MDLLTPRLLPRTLLRTLSRAIPGRPAPHLGGAAIQCPVLLPRPLGHLSRVPRLARPAHPFHISSPTPAPPPGQVQLASPLPSHHHPHPTHSPAVVGFHPDLVRMVPAAAAACDRVRHGTAVSLGRHLLPPPPQRWRPRGAPGAVGDSEARVSPGAAAARSPTCPPRPRRGPRGRLAGAAGTRTAPPTASGRHCLCCSRGPARLPPPPLPPHTLQRPTFRGRAGATIDPTQDARLNHSYGGKETGREEGGC